MKGSFVFIVKKPNVVLSCDDAWNMHGLKWRCFLGGRVGNRMNRTWCLETSDLREMDFSMNLNLMNAVGLTGKHRMDDTSLYLEP